MSSIVPTDGMMALDSGYSFYSTLVCKRMKTIQQQQEVAQRKQGNTRVDNRGDKKKKKKKNKSQKKKINKKKDKKDLSSTSLTSS